MEHHHHHGHCHNHAPQNFNRAFAIGTTLNLLFVVIEFGFGVTANSMALIADASHNLSDVLSLLLAWCALYLASLSATPKHTYGYQRFTILASLISALMLLVAMGGIAWEAIERFQSDTPVNSGIVMAVSGIGVIINTATALLFMKGQKHDLNIRGAYLHMAADAAVSLGVVVAGAGIWLFGWLWLDPLISLVVVAVVLVSTWHLLRSSLELALDAVPSHIDGDGVRKYLDQHELIDEYHDLHIWGLSTTEVSLTAHLVTSDIPKLAHELSHITHTLETQFNIAHSTLQIEPKGDQSCSQSCDAHKHDHAHQ